MRFIWISAVKDLRRLRREPITLLTWLGVPTFIALLLTIVFGRGEARPHGTLLMVDEDRDVASTILSAAFSQGPLASMLTVEKVSRVEGRRRIDAGNASALLIVPRGFSTALFQNQPAKLELVRNPAQRIIPDMVEDALSIFTDGAFYLRLAAGGRDLRNVFQRPLIRLETKVIANKTDRPGGFGTLLLPGMLYMAVFFIAGGFAGDVWRERNAGALRRVATTPASLGAFLAGKLLATALVLGAVGAFGLIVAHLLLNVPLTNFPLAALWVAATGAGLYLLMMLLQSMASTERVANLLANFILLPLTMLGGSFFPLEIMPHGLASVGRWTPNGWSVVQLQSILGGSLDLNGFAVVALFIAALWSLAVWRIRSTP